MDARTAREQYNRTRDERDLELYFRLKHEPPAVIRQGDVNLIATMVSLLAVYLVPAKDKWAVLSFSLLALFNFITTIGLYFEGEVLPCFTKSPKPESIQQQEQS